MMDHTLIVYTSNNADKQHTSGANWPVMLLGNFDGAFKTGCFTNSTANARSTRSTRRCSAPPAGTSTAST